MTGIDFSTTAIEHIQSIDPQANVAVADVRDLPFSDEQFEAVLAFGLFHNFQKPQDLVDAFSETIRVLETGGKMVLSVRCDSLENHLIEHITNRRSDQNGKQTFHKLHFTEADIQYFLESNGMQITDLEYARNVSFLFKFNTLRVSHLKEGRFDESVARAKGFQLNSIGNALDTLLHRLFPKQFSNVIVVTAEKKT
jgi:SAM-dependent methyltransferase